MPGMLELSMNGGKAPESELAALTDGEDDDVEEEDETVGAVVVISDEEGEEVGTVPAPPMFHPCRSGYM